MHCAVSHRVGSVRLTETFIDRDPPAASEIAAVYGAAREAFTHQPLAPSGVLHGVAGTVTTAGALHRGLRSYAREVVDNTRMGRPDVEALRDALARQTVTERLVHPLLPSGRAEAIVAGLTIVLAAMDHCGAATLVVRDRGLRYALL